MENHFLSLYFPQWLLELTKKELVKKYGNKSSSNFALFTTHRGVVIITHLTYEARCAGIKRGMTLLLARTISPETYFTPFCDSLGMRALTTLKEWAYQFAPYVEEEKTSLSSMYPFLFAYGITLDITRTERSHKGLSLLLRTLHAKVVKASLTCRHCVAPTRSAAWSIARTTSQESVILSSKEELSSYLVHLPLRALSLSPSLLSSLLEIGFTSVGSLLTLPSHELSERYGRELPQELSQLIGDRPEQGCSYTVTDTWILHREYDPPIENRTHLCQEIAQLLSELSEKLFSVQKQAKEYTVSFVTLSERREKSEFSKTFSLITPISDISTFFKLLQPSIEKITFQGKIVFLKVEGAGIAVLTPQNSNFFSSEATQSAHEDLSNTLSLTLGRESIKKLYFKSSYTPERSFVFETPSLYEEVKSCTSHTTSSSDSTPSPYLSRPSILFSSPYPITALSLLPDKPPSLITWNRQRIRITQGYGPERISLEWWDDSSKSEYRDYFTIQDDEGKWWWVYRTFPDQQWYIHGVWG
jgi:protein ImuB